MDRKVQLRGRLKPVLNNVEGSHDVVKDCSFLGGVLSGSLQLPRWGSWSYLLKKGRFGNIRKMGGSFSLEPKNCVDPFQ